MISFSVCLISKNEEKNIGQCIDAIMPLVMALPGSEILVADTGSEDDTVRIAMEKGARAIPYIWKNDFSDARNFVADMAVNDLILSVDCDEFLMGFSDVMAKDFDRAVGANYGKIGMSVIVSRHYQGGELLCSRDKIGRFYDRRQYRFSGSIHENLRPVSEGYSRIQYFDLGLKFDHVGYDTPELRSLKAGRNLELLKSQLSDNPEDPYLLYQAGKCHVMLGQQKEASKCYEKALENENNHKLVYIKDLIVSYAYCLIESKDFVHAVGMEKYKEDLCTYADYMFALGLIHMNLARFAEAINDFTEASSCEHFSVEGTNSYKAFYNIGVIYEVTGEIIKARQYYIKCGEYGPAKARLRELGGM